MKIKKFTILFSIVIVMVFCGCFFVTNKNKKNEVNIYHISENNDSIIENKILSSAKIEHFPSHFDIELNVKPFHLIYKKWKEWSPFYSRMYALFLYKNQNILLEKYSIDSLHVILTGKSTVNLFTTKNQVLYCYKIDDSYVLFLSKIYNKKYDFFSEPDINKIFILKGSCFKV